VVYVSARYGWDCLFVVLSVAALLAGAVLLPIWNLKPSMDIDVPVDEELPELVACAAGK
jgi:sugar phosphate permease